MFKLLNSAKNCFMKKFLFILQFIKGIKKNLVYKIKKS